VIYASKVAAWNRFPGPAESRVEERIYRSYSLHATVTTHLQKALNERFSKICKFTGWSEQYKEQLPAVRVLLAKARSE